MSFLDFFNHLPFLITIANAFDFEDFWLKVSEGGKRIQVGQSTVVGQNTFLNHYEIKENRPTTVGFSRFEMSDEFTLDTSAERLKQVNDIMETLHWNVCQGKKI